MALNTRILIIGQGRVGNALSRVLAFQSVAWLQIPGRSSESEISKAARDATHIFIAVSDSVVGDVANLCRQSRARLVHFAAAVSLPGVARWHPLAAFGDRTPKAEDFAKVLFVGDEQQNFADDMPGLVNPHLTLPSKLFLNYHALCFLGAGLSLGPVKHAYQALKGLGLPEQSLKIFFSSAFAAFLDQPDAPTSGPHTRKDFKTIQAHQSVLSSESLSWYQTLLKGDYL
jgi:hypothetical protein